MFQLKKNGFIFVSVLAVLLLFSCNAKDKAAAAPNETAVNDLAENVNMGMEESLLAEKSLEKVRYDSSLQVGFAK